MELMLDLETSALTLVFLYPRMSFRIVIVNDLIFLYHVEFQQ